MKNKPIFQKSRKVETDTKTLWQYELCNDHQTSNQGCYTYYICYLQRDEKKERKTNYFAKNTKKKSNQKTWKKQKCKREEICVPFNLRKQQNETKIIIIFIYIGGFLIYTTYYFFDFLVFEKTRKTTKNKRKIKTNLSGIH